MLLSSALEQASAAEASWLDDYTVCVSESAVTGYDVTIQKGQLPPHFSRHYDTLLEVEEALYQGEHATMPGLDFEPIEDE